MRFCLAVVMWLSLCNSYYREREKANENCKQNTKPEKKSYSGNDPFHNSFSVKTGDKVAQSRLFFVDSEKVINTYDVNAPASPVQKFSDSMMTVGAVHYAVSSKQSKQYDMPSSYSLEQNFPNPFNPSTTIRYTVSNNAKVSILLHDMTGKEISTLVSENKSAGSYDLRWNGTSSDGRKLASGTYFYTMVVEDENGLLHKETRKMSMVK
jgi:hypothetical protein